MDAGSRRKPETPHIMILGGGPAGLAVGYYAKKSDLRFTIIEAGDRVGGNAVTLRHKDFLFDSGAHRFHDKDSQVTAEVKALLAEQLKQVDRPSQIYHNGKFTDFPLSPFNLVRNLGLVSFARATVEVLQSRLRSRRVVDSFEDFALSTYGRTIADRFLLGYSEKLWGAPCSGLSPAIAGARMKGLDLKTFVKEVAFGRRTKAEHLDGAFYYPDSGFGTISEKLGEICGRDNIRLQAAVTGIQCEDQRIASVQINEHQNVATDEVVSTLPLDRLLQILDPAPPAEVMAVARHLRYRNVVLVAVFLDRPSVTRSATVYFPEPSFPFTRLYEPNNRYSNMSPPGKTSLVAEIPCQAEDATWTMDDSELSDLVTSAILRIGWITRDEIIDTAVARMPYAYPILERGFEQRVNRILSYLGRFSNLQLAGRSGRFLYTHVHDMMRTGMEIVDGYTSRGAG
jgi:protoporphyrinogen oxidase